jgi:hypothetical protein
MSTLAVILIVVVVLLLVLFAGGAVVVRRRLERPDFDADVRAADRALERARAEDRGWDRELLHGAARQALDAERPGFEVRSLDLVLVDDRPGVEEDRAHLVALGDGGRVHVILTRDAEGRWEAERLE